MNRTTPVAITLLIPFQVACLQATAAPTEAGPSLPFKLPGAYGGACGQYHNTWRAMRRIPVYETEKSNRVVFFLKSYERFIAISGNVYTTEPSKYRVGSGTVIFGWENGRFRKFVAKIDSDVYLMVSGGDLADNNVLWYMGHVLYNSNFTSAWEQVEPFGYNIDWRVHIKTKSGKIGWIRAKSVFEDDGIDKDDACGD